LSKEWFSCITTTTCSTFPRSPSARAVVEKIKKENSVPETSRVMEAP